MVASELLEEGKIPCLMSLGALDELVASPDRVESEDPGREGGFGLTREFVRDRGGIVGVVSED